MSDQEAASGGGSERKPVEVSARTVDEAIARGLVRLGGLGRNEVKIEILSEGKAGVLGIGAAEASVRLTPLGPGQSPTIVERMDSAPSSAEESPDEEPGDEEESAGRGGRRRRRRRRGRRSDREAESSKQDVEPTTPEPAPTGATEEVSERTRQPRPSMDGDLPEVAQQVIIDLLETLGYDDVRVELQEGLLPDAIEDDDAVVLCVKGASAERLLARDGHAMQALQFITRLIVSRETDEWTNLLIDVEGDRRRQVKELVALARQSADLVETDGRPVSLPPMGAYERRVVHLVLQDHDTIVTQSIGSGDGRKVTVRRKDQLLPRI